MAVKGLGYRCWVLDGPAESGEMGSHFATADEAMKDVAADTSTTHQLAAPCSVVVCDTPGCGEELESADEGWTVHLANPADAENYAVIQGWTVGEDGSLSCYFDPEDDGEAGSDPE